MQPGSDSNFYLHLKLFPGTRVEKIKVIYHGYDKKVFNENISQEKTEKIKSKYKINFRRYIIYVGAIQPRKNIEALIDAFADLRNGDAYKDLGLVIAGELGWLYGDIIRKIKKTDNVLATGRFDTEELPALFRSMADLDVSFGEIEARWRDFEKPSAADKDGIA